MKTVATLLIITKLYHFVTFISIYLSIKYWVPPKRVQMK